MVGIPGSATPMPPRATNISPNATKSHLRGPPTTIPGSLRGPASMESTLPPPPGPLFFAATRFELPAARTDPDYQHIGKRRLLDVGVPNIAMGVSSMKRHNPFGRPEHATTKRFLAGLAPETASRRNIGKCPSLQSPKAVYWRFPGWILKVPCNELRRGLRIAGAAGL